MIRRILIGIGIILAFGITACSPGEQSILQPSTPTHATASMVPPPRADTRPTLTTHSSLLTIVPWQGSSLSTVVGKPGELHCRPGLMSVTPRYPAGRADTPKGRFFARMYVGNGIEQGWSQVIFPMGTHVRAAIVNRSQTGAIMAYPNTSGIQLNVADFGPIYSVTVCVK